MALDMLGEHERSFVAPAETLVGGGVAPGFEEVARTFEQNFHDRSEIGAAFAATRDGRLVVDVWGGLADSARKRRWERNTPVLLFSGTKALVAVCLLILLERGEIELDAPVARYWPEFGAKGKATISVADICAHRARLPALRQQVTEADLTDPIEMAALLADQAPETDPRCDFIYHAITYGWLCGELVRRVDGRSIGRFFAEEVASRLELDIWIGLPKEKLGDVAVMRYPSNWAESFESDQEATARDDLLDSVLNNPVLYPRDRVIWNSPELLRAEIPAINGVGTPRSVARLFGCLARGGEIDGIRLLRPETIELGRVELSRGSNILSMGVRAFAVGFQLQTSARLFGPPADAFGHDGFGGSVLGSWPTERIGFSYAMNQMNPDEPSDPRAQSLLSSLYECVKRLRPLS
jgi:CubicO group peptidase (beta-lactamase class C family)